MPCAGIEPKGAQFLTQHFKPASYTGCDGALLVKMALAFPLGLTAQAGQDSVSVRDGLRTGPRTDSVRDEPRTGPYGAGPYGMDSVRDGPVRTGLLSG